MKSFLSALSYGELPFIVLLTVCWVLYKPVLLLCFLLLPLVWLGAYLRTGRALPTTPLDLPVFLLALWTLFSVAITPDFENSAVKVLGVVLGISYYYALVRLGTGDVIDEEHNLFEYIDGISRLLSSGSILIGSIIALLGLFGADWFTKYRILTRAANLIPDLIPPLPGAELGFQPNAISGTLSLFTPLSIYYVWEIYKSSDNGGMFPNKQGFVLIAAKIIFGGLVAAQGLWWILAQTRGAWLGLACGLLFLTILEFKPRWKAAAWLIPLAPVAVAYGYWFRSDNLGAAPLDLNALSGANLTGSLQFRFQVWEWAGFVLQNFPFTGLGYDIFRKAAPMLYFGPDLGDVAHAHNMWLNIGVTLGYGGMIIYMALWLVNGYTLWKTWAKNRNQRRGKVALGGLAGWYAYSIFGLADTIPLGSKFGLAIFLSLAVGQVVVLNGKGKAENGEY